MNKLPNRATSAVAFALLFLLLRIRVVSCGTMSTTNVDASTTTTPTTTNTPQITTNSNMSPSVTVISSNGATATITLSSVASSTAAQQTTVSPTTTVQPTTLPTTTLAPCVPPNLTTLSVTALNYSSLWINTTFVNGANSSFSVTYELSYNATTLIQKKTQQSTAPSGSSSVEFDDLIPGANYNVSVQACCFPTESGSCSAAMSSANYNTYPAIPSQIMITSTSTNSVDLAWSQAGFADSYLITVSCEANNCNSSNSTLSNMNCSVSNVCMHHVPYLISGQQYNVTVRAFRGQLWSSASAPQTFVTDPAVPSQIMITSTSTNSVDLAWSQAGFADSYLITVSCQANNCNSSNSTLSNTNCAVSSTPYVCMYHVPHLPISGQQYSVTVRAIRGQLWSSASAPQTFVTVPPTPNVTAGITTNSSILIDFVAVPSSGYVQSYSVICNSTPPDSSCNKARSFYPIDTTAEYSANVTGLLSGYTYQLYVYSQSYNISSSALLLQPVTTVPSQPTTVNATSFTNSSATVSFSYPDTSWCSSISVTLYSVSAGNVTNLTFCSLAVSKPSSVNVNGLSDNTLYNILVRVTSTYLVQDKTSEFMYGSVTTLPASVGMVNAVAQAQSVNISWVAPTHSNNLSYTINVSSTVYGLCMQTYHLALSSSCPSTQDVTSNCMPLLSATSCSLAPLWMYFSGLNASSTYSYTVVAVNSGGPGFGQLQNFTTQGVAPNLGWIAAVVVGFLLLVLIVVLLIYFLVYKRRRTTRDKLKPVPPRQGSDNPAIDLGRITPDEESHAHSVRSVTGIPNPTFEGELIERPSPVRIDEFLNHVQMLHKDSDYRFSNEYQLLQKLSPKHPMTASELPVNRVKNRYTNILPFDHSRVKLIPLDDDDTQGSDYINASFMPGYSSKREFIAAQGPMKCTIDDFWRMIWEQNVSILVVVTNLHERGREKCVLYWPTEMNEAMCYGDIQVSLVSESTLNYYVLRVMEVRLEGQPPRELRHYHFVGFPDFSVPTNVTEFLEFVGIVREATRRQYCPGGNVPPVIVQCSAGVGRTGTFIVIDHLLQLIRSQSTIDIFGIVLDMRNYRSNMIQTEAQYIFTHDCIKLAIEMGLHLAPVDSDQGTEVDALYVNTSELRGSDGSPRDASLYMNGDVEDKNLVTFRPSSE